MKLEFERLSVAGFRSFNDKAIITFEPGLHFVAGENQDEPRLEANDVGKSTLFDSLCWVLYGKTVKNLRNTDIVPWSGNKETKVILTISTDGEQHKITRTVNPSNLTVDGQKVGQEDVVKLIGIDYEVFTHTILLGQGQPLFFDKTPSEKMQVLSDVLNLERWEERSKSASNRVNDLTTRKEESERKLAGITRSSHELESLIHRARDQRKQWDEEKASQIAGWEGKLKSYKDQLAKILNVWDEAVLARDGAGMEIDHLEKQLEKCNRTARVVELKVLGKCAELKPLESQLKNLSTTCPTCGQTIRPETAAKHRGEVLKRVRRLQEEMGLVEIEFETSKHAVTVAQTQLNDFRKREQTAADKIEQLNPQKVMFETKISELKKYSQEQKEHSNPYLQQLNDLRKKYKRLQEDQIEIKQDIAIVSKRVERAQFWVKGFKDVRLYIVEELLAEYELVTNTALETMGLVDWSVAYGIEKETKAGGFTRGLNVMIRSPKNTDQVKWEVWGGGVGQRLRLIGSLALSEVLLSEANIHTNLEILDEPSRGLASGGVNDLVNMLADRAEQTGKCILFVDHHLVRSTKFASTIHVTKKKDGSHVHIS